MRKKNANKCELECYHCRKIGHTMWNCKNLANNLLKEKVKESTNKLILSNSVRTTIVQ